MANPTSPPEPAKFTVGMLFAIVDNNKAHILVVALLSAVLFLLYNQTHLFDYVYYDDSSYVLDNLYVRSGLTLDGIRWAFTSYYMSNWHPLTWLSHMLDVSLFGVDPGWAHVHNYLLHGLNSVLLYIYFLRLSGKVWTSFILSLVFLVHPLHVESVAWIAERKDLLCALFFILSLISYDIYRAKPTLLRYLGVIVTFCLALLAKPMAVTLPALLLVLDRFIYRDQLCDKAAVRPLNPNLYLRLVVEKLPLIALSAAMCIVTIIAQHEGGSIADIETMSFTSRLFTAYYGLGIYLQQMILPTNLVPYYSVQAPSSWLPLAFPSLLLLGWLATSLVYIRKLPLIAAGFFWYVITLLPVIGLVQVGAQSHADRYMYLPSIGVLMAVSYLLPNRLNRYSTLSKLLSIIFSLYLSVICYWQISYWENQRTLYSHQLTTSGPSWRAHINLAAAYTNIAMWDEAERHAQAAVDIRPRMSQSYQALGDIALFQENYSKAEEIYMTAVRAGTFNGKLLNNLGMVLEQQGKTAAALEVFEGARYLNPALIQARDNIERLNGHTRTNEAKP